MVFSNRWELAFGVASFGTGVLSLLLAVAVFLGNHRLSENRAWALASLSVALWSGGLGFAILSPDKKTSLMWNQIFYTGGVWIPTTFFRFVTIFTHKPIKRPILFGCVALSFFLTLILWVKIDWFVKDLIFRGPFRFWDVLGPAYHVFTVFFFLIMGYSFFCLYQTLGADPALDKIKLRWMAMGITCGMLGGSTNFFYDYNLNIYPFGQFLVFLYPLLISWAIVKHQALDIGSLLRKTGLIVSIYLLLIALVIPIPIFVHKEIHHLLGPWTYMILLEVVLVSAVLSLGPFLYAVIVQRGSVFREDTLAGLTHELKSPLAAIESALDVLNDQLKSHSGNRKGTAYLKMIERNSARLRIFIEDLLQVFGQKAKSRLLNIEAVDLAQLIRKACAAVKPMASAKGILVRHEVDGSLVIRCDSKRIELVLSNLLSNAAKFSHGGRIDVHVKQDSQGVEIEVLDSGQGIGPDELPYIFDRFFQGRRGHHSNGTGIGLYIAKAWVEAHGGEIGVESDGEGKGSRFWFTLPK